MKLEIGKDDANIYKAISILFIAVHNFTHWLPHAPGENEFSFDPERWNNYLHLSIEEPFKAFFSFFGH